MATNAAKTEVTKTPTVKKNPVDLITRVTTQLERAVLTRKITKDDLATLSASVARLNAFLA